MILLNYENDKKYEKKLHERVRDKRLEAFEECEHAIRTQLEYLEKQVRQSYSLLWNALESPTVEDAEKYLSILFD